MVTVGVYLGGRVICINRYVNGFLDITEHINVIFFFNFKSLKILKKIPEYCNVLDINILFFIK